MVVKSRFLKPTAKAPVKKSFLKNKENQKDLNEIKDTLINVGIEALGIPEKDKESFFYATKLFLSFLKK